MFLSAGCSPDSGPSLGKAYVAPASINLRGQLNQKNSTVAVLKHGDPVNITDVRRRFVKVRTVKGAEGWVDSLELLSAEEMDQLGRERKAALALPSEGKATAYETLNIHLAPDRRSPAFTQIPEGGAVSVLAHRVAPKISGAAQSSSLVLSRPQPPLRKARKDRAAQNSVRLPPKPAPPKPPPDWEKSSALGSSGTDDPDDAGPGASKKEEGTAEKTQEQEKPAVMESWTLVRTKGNQVGWVLSRNLMMSIPDDVAQYANGKRITSFFDLGAVNDEEKGVKHNWLWTTASSGLENEFDAWRVFLWNRHRHRFETSYRQRDLEGYFPVTVDPPDNGAFGRTFKLIMKDDDHKFRRRTYLFDGTRVHLTGTEDYQPELLKSTAPASAVNPEKIQARIFKNGWLKREWVALKDHFSGRH